MATQKTVIHLVKAVAATLVLIIAAFLLSAWIGSSIPRNANWQEPETGVTIMLETNGVHTGIIMPLVTAQKDWRKDFPASDLTNPTRQYTHVSVSFGEREVFLSTPDLIDVSPAAIIKAAIGGNGMLHAAHYVRPAPADDFRKLRITQQQYSHLVAAIEAQVPPFNTDRKAYAGYAAHDVFYDTQQTYHLGNTCNQWTSNMLAQAGIKTGWWTPLSGGVMKWVKTPE